MANLRESTRLNRPRRKVEEAEMDITPMIDCTFLLLIFFLVSSKMQAGEAIDLPPARHGSVAIVKESVILTVTKGPGEIANVYKGDGTTPANLIDGSTIAGQEAAIQAYVEEQVALDPLKVNVLIKAEKGLKHRDVTRVARAAGQAEVPQLYVAVLESQ
ncbi:Biopolymer transport protein ExbD/TolR [Pirellula staleyi DSM 6068]|uniref:Biopolymer transport protein ExbD/TolR n=1 Tax=Pirellula staleyi (strain ATCC 27377 / DSM 6068 / ICPB 4128) TaxID=530564 RepID=D2R6T4_PIRSD|nr:biopolymer transporter ExbD [Pirellula staleyi]ADB17384.1 Biopolymer transport protein ExbD/TolR [Pirellula staleyi DSM 6068]